MRWLMAFFIVSLIAGCSRTSQPVSVSQVPDLFSGPVQVEASSSIDRSQPNWLQTYCLERIQQIAQIPSRYERIRGPILVLNPVHRSERFANATQVATCNIDFYILPLAVEAFDDVGVVHQYNKLAWSDFYQATNASISGQLVADNWQEVMLSEDATDQPALSLIHELKPEKITEYLDVFYTKDEEIIFELVVVDNQST